MLIRVNFCNDPDWYQCGHFFIGEGESGEHVKERMDNAFHGFHFARVSIDNANLLPKINWLALNGLGLEFSPFIPGMGKLRIFWETIA